MFWYNLVTLGDTRLLKKVYLVTKRIGKKSWAHTIKDILETYGLMNLWSDEQLLFNLDGKGNLGSKSLWNHKRFGSAIFEERSKSTSRRCGGQG